MRGVQYIGIVADRSMKIADNSVVPNVFLSFSTMDKSLVEKFRHQATNSLRGLVLRDCSITESVEGEWKVHAERLIRRSSVTICLVGKGTWRSKPVNWELRKSAALGKRVVAVRLESNIVRTPAALQDVGATLLPWDVDKIVDKLHDEQRAVS